MAMSAPVAAAARRNGKPASCEPCRKGKIRCDHQRPVCGRCERRGAASGCYYHPNPLTKPRPSRVGTSPLPTPESGHRSIPEDHHPTTHSFDISSITPPNNLLAATSDIQDAYTRHIQAVVEIVACLKHFATIYAAVENYVNAAQVAFCPGPLTLYALSSLRRIAECFDWDDRESNAIRCQQAAVQIIEATTHPVVVTADLDYRGFSELYIGEQLRLEFMGLIFATAARATLYRLAPESGGGSRLTEPLFQASVKCLELSRQLAPEANDVLCWLSYEILRATTIKNGNLHSSVWFRLGDISSDIYALGIHREAFNSKDTPFFLAECRRKLWSCVYHFDKLIAVMFDRPPRLIARYGDCKLPLDLSDVELLSLPQELERARVALTPDGWSSTASYHSVTWARLRSIQSAFREKVIDLGQLSLTTDNVQALRTLATQSMDAWDRLPAHLKYHPNMFNMGLPTSTVLMVAIVYLLHLQTDFQIHRILQKSHAEADERLMQVCAETIAVVVHLGSVRDRAVFLREDNAYVMICYGLPCAATLVEKLQLLARCNNSSYTSTTSSSNFSSSSSSNFSPNASSNLSSTLSPSSNVNSSDKSAHASPSSLPSGLSRPRLLRNLSVFITYLETICDPHEANYSSCVRAAKAIGRALDEILDPRSMSVATHSTHGDHDHRNDGTNGQQGRAQAVTQTESVGNDNVSGKGTHSVNGNDINNGDAYGPAHAIDENTPSLPGSSALGTLADMDMSGVNADPQSFDAFEFDAWMKGIDWSATTGDWSIL